jgi:hypothetical protein
MEKFTRFIKGNRLLSFVVIVFILFVAADRVDVYHINLKGDLLGVNTALKHYPILMENKDGNAFFTVDSAGAVTATSFTPTSYTAPTFTGTVTATGHFIADLGNGTTRFTVGSVAGTGRGRTYLDSLYVGKVFGSYFISDLSNGTPRFTVGTVAGTGAGNFYADSAHLGITTFSNITTGIDSFLTTGAVDSITLANNITSGYTEMSNVNVYQIVPAYSTEVDTAIYSGGILWTGAHHTVLVARRCKSYTGNGATALKSGAQLGYRVIK